MARDPMILACRAAETFWILLRTLLLTFNDPGSTISVVEAEEDDS